jgi:hypothetical protein
MQLLTSEIEKRLANNPETEIVWIEPHEAFRYLNERIERSKEDWSEAFTKLLTNQYQFKGLPVRIKL